MEQPPDHLMFKIWPIFYYQTRVLLASYPVGKNWVYNFFGYCNELKTTYSRRYNYKRALCEDSKIIKKWSNRVQITIMQYGIAYEDIYNLNKTGYAIGLTTTANVVTRADLYGKRRVIRPGSRD
jgi:hypothetical protein